MKFLFATFVSLFLTGVAHADQAATLTCTGTNVVLAVKSPYLGENSTATQQLYVLKSVDSNDGETANTAFFLDVKKDSLSGTKPGVGWLIYSGKNSAGGSFDMMIRPWKDSGSQTVIRQTSNGTITYLHGPLAGMNESVDCVLE